MNRSAKGAPQRDVHVPGGIRLQKVLASAGVGSRRACEAVSYTHLTLPTNREV